MKKYICLSCSNEFRSDAKPKMCPVCGGTEVDEAERKKARQTAESYIFRLKELKPMYEEAFDKFGEIYGEVEFIMQVLRPYQTRGIVKDYEIPVFERRNLRDYLKKYREARKDG